METPPNPEITSALPFETLIRSFSSNERITDVGFTIIPQEGERTAGIPAHCQNPILKKLDVKVFNEINNYLSNLLKNRPTELDHHMIDEKTEVYLFPIQLNFVYPVGYVWCCIDTPMNENIRAALKSIADEIAIRMELSKRNFFYRNLSSWLIDELNENAEIDELIQTIKLGVYCDAVYVWELIGNTLVPKNFKGLELPRLTSAAGHCLDGNYTEKIPDIENSKKLFKKDFFLTKNLKSCFLFPVKFYAKDSHVGVVGAFYKRKYGITEIDRELCSYSLKYHESLWRSKYHNKNSLSILTPSASDLFYKQSVNCLFDFHDIGTIVFGLDGAVEQLELSTKGDIKLHVDRCRKAVQKIKNLTVQHDTTLTLAKDHKSIASVLDDYTPRKINILNMVSEEIDLLRTEAEASKIKIDFSNKLTEEYIRIQPEDLKALLNNTIHNSIRSFMSITHRSKKISVSFSRVRDTLIISTWDNGSGINPEDIDRIFEPNFTTHRKTGGRGLGLAKVRAIMVGKYSEQPSVRSLWGEWTEITTKIRIYP